MESKEFRENAQVHFDKAAKIHNVPPSTIKMLGRTHLPF
jgi:hypothetical protein